MENANEVFYKLEREVTYMGVAYIVVEDLSSDYLLVVRKNGGFPAAPVVIPGVG